MLTEPDQQEVKPCQSCNQPPVITQENMIYCGNAACWMFRKFSYPQQWNSRPIEDTLAKELEAVTWLATELKIKGELIAKDRDELLKLAEGMAYELEEQQRVFNIQANLYRLNMFREEYPKEP